MLIEDPVTSKAANLDLESGYFPKRQLDCGVYVVEKEDIVRFIENDTQKEIDIDIYPPPCNPHLIKGVDCFSGLPEINGVQGKDIPMYNFNVFGCHGRDSGVDRWPFPGYKQGKWMLRPRLGLGAGNPPFEYPDDYEWQRHNIDSKLQNKTIPELVRETINEGERVDVVTSCNTGGYELGVDDVMYGQDSVGRRLIYCPKKGLLNLRFSVSPLSVPSYLLEKIEALKKDPEYHRLLEQRKEEKRRGDVRQGKRIEAILKKNNPSHP
ncbi:MAG: hypothetical protein R6U32_05330 [Candidatus Woesearchaeota archaeon]